MGKLFDSGPSRGDIRRAEEAAFKKEQERLRLVEMKLRRRESTETMQGEGIASTDQITLGNDAASESTGLETADTKSQAMDPTEKPTAVNSQLAQALAGIRNGGLRL